jgi:hypothetical protein
MAAAKPILIEAAFRSGLEKKVAAQLDAAGIEYTFEGERIPYRVPARDAYYLPDFPRLNGTTIIIEAKGRFGHHRGDGVGAKERQKLILVKEQNPHLDIRIVFQDARKPIYKGSKTTYAKWAEDHGFKWADKGTVPVAWIKEMQAARKKR